VPGRVVGRAALTDLGLEGDHWEAEPGKARLCQRTGSRPEREEVSGMLPQPDPRGQGLVEYALILVLVAVFVILLLGVLGNSIGNVFSNILSYL
jgi:pilus assembly protein Flp/PilA